MSDAGRTFSAPLDSNYCPSACVLTAPLSHLLLCDSILKYVTAKHTKVVAKRGFKILQLADQVVFKQVSVTGFDYIFIMAGINDISGLVESGAIATHTVFDVMARFHVLNNVIRARNTHATLLFASILPRADRFQLYFPYLVGLNFALEKWCAQSGGRRVFIPLHRCCLRGGLPRRELYAHDMLHLNGAGVDLLSRAVQQALSPAQVRDYINSSRVQRLASLPY